MTFKRRAQLSVETMIIYGLVILVALAVIGGLLYFNILDISSYLPDKCDIGGTADLKCEEIAFYEDPDEEGKGVLALGIRNIGQKPIEQLNVVAVDDSGIHFSTTESTSGETGSGDDWNGISEDSSLGPGEIARVEIPTDGIEPGKVLRASVETSYKFKDGAIVQRASGDIRIRAS